MADSRKFHSTEALIALVEHSLGRCTVSGQSLCVGLSGGVDSVALLHIVRSLALPISAVHVHHGISPRADQWAEFCQALCSTWNVPLLVKRVNVERSDPAGLEAAARRVRHLVFGAVNADWVVLAHHGDDQAETLLFNLLRGSGVRGAGAMRERHGRLLRPLLNATRADVVAYAEHHQLAWVDDESNADTRFSRNYLRHQVMPLVRQRFPAAARRLAAASEHFSDASDLLDELAQIDLGGDPARFPISVSRLGTLSESRARNLLRFVLSRYGIGIPGERRLVELLHQCLTAKPDRHPAIKFGGHILARRRGMLVLEWPGGQDAQSSG